MKRLIRETTERTVTTKVYEGQEDDLEGVAASGQPDEEAAAVAQSPAPTPDDSDVDGGVFGERGKLEHDERANADDGDQEEVVVSVDGGRCFCPPRARPRRRAR